MQLPISDQKKRALEALDRKFAFDKGKILQQEDRESKRKKRSPNDKQVALVLDGQHGDDRAPLVSPAMIDPSSISKRGHVVFSGNAPRVAEDAHAAYSEISESVDENLLVVSAKVSSRGVNEIVFDLLQHGDKGYKYTKGSIAMKIDNWVPLDNFVPRDGSLMDARLKALQSHSKRSKKHMTMRQHRKCGSFDLPNEVHKFSLFKPMHEMWKEYIMKIFKESRGKSLSQALLVADLHGAFFQVVPKQGSVFIFQAGCWKITLHGDNLALRNNAG